MPLRSCPLPVLLLLASAATAQIAPGNLVVVRAGDGAFALSNSAFPTFLLQYDASTPAQAAPISSLQLPITIAGTSNHGFVTQSVDGRYLVVAGYVASPFTALITFTTSVAFARGIARIALDGTVDATTALTDAHSGGGGLPGDITSAVTVDGSAFWTTGTGVQTGNRAVCYAPLGATTSVQLASTPVATRVASIHDGQLHVSTVSLPQVGINTVGTGLPVTAGQTVALLSGQPGTDGTAQPWDHWFADAATLYVADARTDGTGGIRKWTKAGGTWTLQYTLAPAPNVGCRAVSGVRDLGGTRLWATTSPLSGNQVVAVTDAGAGSPFTTLATAPANTGFRGLRFVRTPYDVSFGGTGCAVSTGIPTIGVDGLPIAGNADFGLAVGNTPPTSLYLSVVSIGLPIQPAGLPLAPFGAPPCASLFLQSLDILHGGVTGPGGAAVTPLGLAPADAALWGLVLGTQHFVFDPGLYPGLGLPVGASTGMQIAIGN